MSVELRIATKQSLIGRLAKYPSLFDATIHSLSEGLAHGDFSSVDLVKVRFGRVYILEGFL